MDRSDITLLLQGAIGDRPEASASELYEAVYGELRQMAGGFMRRERADHTLQATALVNEAYLKLVDAPREEWKGRAHFFGVAARAMRQILVDHARRHGAEKRGGDVTLVPLEEDVAAAPVPADVLDVHHALEKLARRDERMARVVEMRIFGGLTAREVAEVLGVSKRTVDSDWQVARLWLKRELRGGE